MDVIFIGGNLLIMVLRIWVMKRERVYMFVNRRTFKIFRTHCLMSVKGIQKLHVFGMGVSYFVKN